MLDVNSDSVVKGGALRELPHWATSDRDSRWSDEAWVCRLQTAFANLFPDSSKFSFTGHFLEDFVKFLHDLRAIFHGGGPV